ncbi:hypothetical protein ACQY0O_000766 [Thecaphora frezii]
MYAMLCNYESDEELHLLQDGKTRYTSGSCVSCLYHLKDIDGSHQGFFVFPDLSIRVEGVYRLKLCLFETIGHTVHHCKSIYSAPFNVYTAKRFPGMEESTPLSKSFADQGLKVRVRKQPRMRRRGSKRKDGSRSDGSDADNPTTNVPGDRRSPKRSRGSEEPPPQVPPLPSNAASLRGRIAPSGDGPGPALNSGASPRPAYSMPISHQGPSYPPPEARAMPPAVVPPHYYDHERPRPGPSTGRHGEDYPPALPLSRSLPARRGYESYRDEPVARHGYADFEADPRDRMPPPPRRVDGPYVPIYPPALHRGLPDDEAYPPAGRPGGRPRVGSFDAGPRREGHHYYAEEDPRMRERRMGPYPPSGLAPSGYHPAATSMPPSPEGRRSSFDLRYTRSPGEAYVEYPRPMPIAARTSRGPTPERTVSSSMVSDRQRLYIPAERVPPAAAPPSSGYVLPSPAHLSSARSYDAEVPPYDSRRRPHPDDRFVELARGDGIGGSHRPAGPSLESRLPSRQLTPLDPSSADVRDRPTLPPIRDMPPLPSLRGPNRHVSPVPRLPRTESFYDLPPRYPSSRDFDPVTRSVSATPPVLRHPSGSSHPLGPASHYQGPPPPCLSRSPSLASRPSHYAPVAVRPLPGLLSPDIERRSGSHGGGGPPGAVSAPTLDADHMAYRARHDERAREGEAERERDRGRYPPY